MMADGMLNKQIAHDLNVSEATVKAHVSAVLFKLGVESRTQAVIRLARFKEEIMPAEERPAGLQ
jgi:DNA-binding NarL/FixJ family response regulator